MKYFEFNQNNSGGYYVESDEFGIADHIVIEAKDASEAWHKLESMESKVNGLFNYCNCCGERWSYPYKSYDEPTYYGEPLDTVEKGMFHYKTFVHYADGNIKEFIPKEK